MALSCAKPNPAFLRSRLGMQAAGTKAKVSGETFYPSVERHKKESQHAADGKRSSVFRSEANRGEEERPFTFLQYERFKKALDIGTAMSSAAIAPLVLCAMHARKLR